MCIIKKSFVAWTSKRIYGEFIVGNSICMAFF